MAYVTLQREILRFWTRLVGLNVYVLVEGVTVTAHNYVISVSPDQAKHKTSFLETVIRSGVNRYSMAG